MRPLAILLALVGIFGCGQTERVAGNGSETTTGIAARVLDSAGRPVPGATVQARPSGWTSDPADTFDPVRVGAADASGCVRFEALPAGSWTLLSDDGFRRAAATAVVGVLAGAPEARLVLAAGVRVEGRVDLSGGAPAVVAVAGLPFLARTDSLGRFAIDSLPAGRIVLACATATGRRAAAAVAAPSGEVVDAGVLVPAGRDAAGGETDSVAIDLDLGPARPDTILGYPLLLRLSDTAIDFSRSTGADLRFERGGRVLPHQVERWDPAARLADVWVRIDTILPSDRNPSIMLGYGGSGLPDWSSGSDVFDSASGWRGVWHLDAVDPGADATGRHRLLDWRTRDASGTAGRGRFCDTGWLSGSDAPDLRLHGFSVSAWAKRQGPQIATGKLASKGNRDDWRNTWSLQFFDGSWRPGLLVVRDSSVSDTLRAPDPLPDGIWSLVAATRDSSTGSVRLYVDGVLVDSATRAGTLDYRSIAPVNLPLFLGANFIGVLDEVRVSSVARSPSWIALDHALQRPGSRAVHYRRVP